MHWQIYFGLFFCVISSLYGLKNNPNTVLASVAVNNVLESLARLPTTCSKHDNDVLQEKNKRKEWIREKLLMTNNKASFRELNTNELYDIPVEIKPIIQKIFPNSGMIYSINDILENLYEIKDEKETKDDVFNNLKPTEDSNIINIITTLKKFCEYEYISLRNFVQILNDTYIQIPIKMVGLFNKLLIGFHQKDTKKTGVISVDDFGRVIRNCILNDEVVGDIADSFENIENVYYEAWLSKKRKDIDAIKIPKYYMQLLYKVDDDEIDDY